MYTLFRKFLVALTALMLVLPAHSQDQLFTGDKKLACEAIMCLAAGSRPNECEPSIRKYFSIVVSGWNGLKNTVKARTDFLKLCPSASADSKMSALVDALANGAGRCDVESLNKNLATSNKNDTGSAQAIDNALPAYCTIMVGNEYTDPAMAALLPKYVGTPDTGGYWCEPADWVTNQAAWQTVQDNLATSAIETNASNANGG